jgi:hypothetical protein
MPCFDECGCTCDEGYQTFDREIASELGSHLTLNEIIEDRVIWYHDKTPTLENDGFGRWEVTSEGLQTTGGIYVRWRQADFCEHHGREHMQAMYVGKAGKSIDSRLGVHRLKKKVTDSELATYVSIWPCSNRAAKYIEQMLLDL